MVSREAISSSEREKPGAQHPAFSRTRSGQADFGITARPL